MKILFECICDYTNPGDSIVVCGDQQKLGLWNPENGYKMHTNPHTFPAWSSSIINFDTNYLEFKFLIFNQNNSRWENFSENRSIHNQDGVATYKASFNEMHAKVSWSKDSNSYHPTSTSALNRLPTTDITFCGKWLGEEMRLRRSKSNVWVGFGFAGSEGGAFEEIIAQDNTAKSWRKKLTIIKEIMERIMGNISKKPIEELLKDIVDCSTYLGYIRSGILPCQEDGGHYRPNQHSNISKIIFKVSECIMTEVMSRDDMKADEIRVALRGIYPALPSFSNEFSVAQPLTRIRDIAHRNDIPQELKQEIKHKIQNKLHRCAGPEDLRETEKMANRFNENPHLYPHDFLINFNKFHQELKKFFNASDLSERLNLLLNYQNSDFVLDQKTRDLIHAYFDGKRRSDEENASISTLLATMRFATDLRSTLLRHLEESSHSIQQNSDSIDMPLLQNMRLAEINLEEVCFVLLARIMSVTERDVDRWAHPLVALDLGVRSIRMSGFRREEGSAIEKELKLHYENLKDHGEEEFFQFLKATLDRVRRLCESYSDLISTLYGTRARYLGEALNLPDHSINVVAEANIRASVVFPVSGICSVVLKRLRSKLGLSKFDPLVTGNVIGSLIILNNLNDLNRVDLKNDEMYNEQKNEKKNGRKNDKNTEKDSEYTEKDSENTEKDEKNTEKDSENTEKDEKNTEKDSENTEKDEKNTAKKDKIELIDINKGPFIIILKYASGLEEITELTKDLNVVGILLAHDLPHLSHLGVRARQENIVFVTCDDKEIKRKEFYYERNFIAINADPGNVTIQQSSKEDALAWIVGQEKRQRYSIKELVQDDIGMNFRCAKKIIKSEESEQETCGAKSYYCSILSKLSIQSQNQSIQQFHTPWSVTIPFGTMESLLESEGLVGEYNHLNKILNESEFESKIFKKATSDLQKLISEKMNVNNGKISIINDLKKEIINNKLQDYSFICRSSANVEDLKGMSAAGLYDSVPNVNLLEEKDVEAALIDVWKSLFSDRAVAARRMAGISEVSMAVLIQQLVTPTHSFVIHTVNPISKVSSELYFEVAPGLGETLASAAFRGTPYRFTVNKNTKEIRILSFASYSTALIPAKNAYEPSSSDGAASSMDTRLKSVLVDYTQDAFSTSASYRKLMGERLSAIGVFIENVLGCPQDIEGCIQYDKIFIVQTRAQAIS